MRLSKVLPKSRPPRPSLTSVQFLCCQTVQFAHHRPKGFGSGLVRTVGHEVVMIRQHGPCFHAPAKFVTAGEKGFQKPVLQVILREQMTGSGTAGGQKVDPARSQTVGRRVRPVTGSLHAFGVAWQDRRRLHVHHFLKKKTAIKKEFTGLRPTGNAAAGCGWKKRSRQNGTAVQSASGTEDGCHFPTATPSLDPPFAPTSLPDGEAVLGLRAALLPLSAKAACCRAPIQTRFHLPACGQPVTPQQAAAEESGKSLPQSKVPAARIRPKCLSHGLVSPTATPSLDCASRPNGTAFREGSLLPSNHTHRVFGLPACGTGDFTPTGTIRR